jgi:hypothetical protein
MSGFESLYLNDLNFFLIIPSIDIQAKICVFWTHLEFLGGFSPCSQCVPMGFSSSFQNVPNSNSVESHVPLPKVQLVCI